jgi:hypothetical protein
MSTFTSPSINRGIRADPVTLLDDQHIAGHQTRRPDLGTTTVTQNGLPRVSARLGYMDVPNVPEVLRLVETAEIECRIEAERDAFRIHDRAAPWRRANHRRRVAPTPLPRHLRDHRGHCRVVQPTP